MATVMAVGDILPGQHAAHADGYGLLADPEMRRRTHLSFFVELGERFLGVPDAVHAPVQADLGLSGQMHFVRGIGLRKRGYRAHERSFQVGMLEGAEDG